MDEAWLGKTVSVDCEGMGFFQGVIASVHLEEQTITLKSPFLNGVACKMPSVTISAGQIQDLKLLDDDVSSTKQKDHKKTATSTVSVKKKSRVQVADNLAKSSYQSRAAGKSPRNQDMRGSPRKNVERNESFGGGGGYRTPSKKMQQRMQKDAGCFGGEIDHQKMTEDFDFEKNLALFDKRMVFEEIEMENSNQPDVVRLVDCNRVKKNATPVRSEMEPKYRNDQNVLTTLPAQYNQITLEKSLSSSNRGTYKTSEGLMVPAIAYNLRERLMAAAEARGISKERLCELMGRNITDLTIQLLGGSHRLNPKNSHQVPRVVALCGPGRAGSYGLAALRHLASQGVNTSAYLPDLPLYPPHINSELLLYKLCLKKQIHSLVSDPKELPKSVDVILLAMDDHEVLDQERYQPWHKAAILWSKRQSTSVVAIDPPSSDVAKAELTLKASVLPGLPLWFGDNSFGNLYMANLGIPTKVYKDVGITFSSPFGAKPCIQLVHA